MMNDSKRQTHLSEGSDRVGQKQTRGLRPLQRTRLCESGGCERHGVPAACQTTHSAGTLEQGEDGG